MKKVILSLAVVFTLGMVSCGGHKENANEENPANAPVEEVTDEEVVVENPDGQVVGEGEVIEEGTVAPDQAAPQNASDVKTKSQNAVQEAKQKAEEAVTNATNAVENAAVNAAQTVADEAQSAADKVKNKVRR